MNPLNPFTFPGGRAAVRGLVSLGAALLLGGCGSSQPTTETLAQVMDDTALEHAAKHVDPKYVCPMHPQIVKDAPGTCPICGMTLVPQQADAGAGDERPVVAVAAHTAQNMGLRLGRVERATLWKYIETVGYVVYDEDAVSHVHPRASGWVEQIHVHAEGDRVQQGGVLVEVYAPEIVAAQEEFLITLRARGTVPEERKASLYTSAQRRLRLLEVPQHIIDAIARTQQVQRTIPILAPRDGIVTRLGVRHGMYVTPELEMYTIAELSSVWVLVDVFEDQLDWVRPGRPAEVRVAALPGKVWKGEVDYVYPELDPKTRTLKVRLRIPNPGGALRPNMFADAIIYGGPKRDVLAIPRETLIEAPGGARVVRLVEEGKFQPVPVAIGMRSQDQVEVLAGLEEGDRIVLSGQFLIDSESNLRASLRRLGAAPDGSPHPVQPRH